MILSIKLQTSNLHKPLSPFFDDIFAICQCGFRKNHSTQHGILVLLEPWKRNDDQEMVFGALLIDLLKVFDCLPHDLLLAKLQACGVDNKSLALAQDTFQIKTKGLKLEQNLVHGNKFYLVFRRVLYLVPFFQYSHL